jgi:IclR family KDG regulon transcriptional repressor
MVYILKIESTKIVRMVSQIGRVVPIHCTALGKAYLSRLSDNVIQNKLADYEFKRYSPNSITNIRDFLKELKLTRTRGYATDLGENDFNVYCVGAPIINQKNEPLASISISMPSGRFNQKMLSEYGKSISEAAQEISNHLQYIPT